VQLMKTCGEFRQADSDRQTAGSGRCQCSRWTSLPVPCLRPAILVRSSAALSRRRAFVIPCGAWRSLGGVPDVSATTSRPALLPRLIHCRYRHCCCCYSSCVRPPACLSVCVHMCGFILLYLPA